MNRYIIEYVASQTENARLTTFEGVLADSPAEAQFIFIAAHPGAEIVRVEDYDESKGGAYGLGKYTAEERADITARHNELRRIEAASYEEVTARISIYTLDEFAARAEYEQRRASSTTPNAEGVFVGDLFRDEWGYEQTNVDYYQVVALKGRHTIIVKRLNEKHGEVLSENGISTLTGRSRPIRDSFKTDDPIMLRTKADHGQPSIKAPSGYGCLMPAKDGELYDWTAYG